MSPLTDAEVRRLSLIQREVLIRHVGSGDQQMIRDGSHLPADKLIDLKCLRLIEGGRATAMTERGRHAAAVILGEYADALVAAGCLDLGAMPIRPSELIARLKASRRPALVAPADLAALMAEKRSPA